MLNREQLESMLEMQSAMNVRVNPKWLTAGYPFLLAAVIEGGEAIEHAGWKWWKAQTRDLAQLRMELVDMWHFALSDCLVRHGGDQATAANSLLLVCESQASTLDFDNRVYDLDEIDMIRRLELLIGLAAARRFDVSLFGRLLADCDMSWGDLHVQYVGKNVLNFFRQDHGYKEGSYQKIWGGREDNEHLADILQIIDHGAPSLRKDIYFHLEHAYKVCCCPPAANEPSLA